MKLHIYKKLAIFLCLIVPFSVLAEQTVINFSEFDEPGGDTVLDFQYTPQGVRFRASAFVGTSPDIPNCRTIPLNLYDLYGFGNPAMRCRHIFSNFPDVGIIARFVDPEKFVNRNIYARKISFDLNIVVGSGASITRYDHNGDFIGGTSVSGGGLHQIEVDDLTHDLRISVSDQNSTFAIDNFSYELFKLKIIEPSIREVYRLTNNNYREIEVEYQTDILDRKISFTNLGVWSTSQGSRGLSTILENFSGSLSGPVKKTYTAKGGKFTVNASLSGTGVAAVAKPVTFYIVGSDIPQNIITERLVSLYSKGATPRLLTGIAKKESNYKQFRMFSLLDIVENWPNESAEDGGSHIGLMQVGTTYDRAWDWLENTKYGKNHFTREKLPAARRNERRIRNGLKKLGVPGHAGLRAMTSVERENMALLLYGPYAPGSINIPAPTLAEKILKQYYIPKCVGGTVTLVKGKRVCEGGTWEWSKNAGGNFLGVAYADDVRSKIVQ